MQAPIQILQHTDIYLIDQILKGRYHSGETILDAGAGSGRNINWFVQANCVVYGTDRSMDAIEALRQNYPTVPAAHFIQAPVEQMPFADGFFDHIISSAVLHFADSHAHFEAMFGEMVRVLKPGGSLFIRMTTDEGLETPGADLGDGRYFLGDGSERYLLSRERLDQLILDYSLEWLEPFKTVVVERVRSMAVIMLSKR